MKKILAVLAAALIATSAFAKVGLIGGVSFSPNQVSFKDVQQWHAGLTWEAPLGIGFSLQPSLLYATKAGLPDPEAKDPIIKQLSMGYVQLPVQLLWGPDIADGNFKPYVFGEPYVGYNLTQNGKWVDVRTIKDVGKLFDWGVGLGIGVKLFKHLQITAKYVFSIGTLEGQGLNFNIKNPDALQISAAILF